EGGGDDHGQRLRDGRTDAEARVRSVLQHAAGRTPARDGPGQGAALGGGIGRIDPPGKPARAGNAKSGAAPGVAAERESGEACRTEGRDMKKGKKDKKDLSRKEPRRIEWVDGVEEMSSSSRNKTRGKLFQAAGEVALAMKCGKGEKMAPVAGNKQKNPVQ